MENIVPTSSDVVGTPPERGRTWLPLDTVRDTFALLVAGPEPLTIAGGDFPGLPDRAIPLDELRDRLLRRSRYSQTTRDAVWTYLTSTTKCRVRVIATRSTRRASAISDGLRVRSSSGAE
jgi:hypothetical protein